MSTPAPAAKTPFSEPTNVREFNERLREHDLPLISARQYMVLRDMEGRTHLVSGLRALHDGGQNRDRAKTYFKRVIAAAVESAGAAPATQSPPSSEIPKGLGPYDAGDLPGASAASGASAQQQPQQAQQRRQGAGNVREMPRSTPATRPPAEERSGTPQSAPAQEGEQRRQREQARAYGKSAALCVEIDDTRGGAPTLRFEFAKAIKAKEYDWNSKLIVQLTRDEVVKLLAVMLGFAPAVKFDHHGETNQKFMQVEFQDGGYYFKAGDKDVQMLTLPISTPADHLGIFALAMRQARKIGFGIDGFSLMEYVRLAVAPRIKPVEQRRQAQA